MSDKSKIQWTDATWNPTRGCSKVSEGCRTCYAMQFAHRFDKPGLPYEGLTKIVNGKPEWNNKIKLIPDALQIPIKWKKGRKIFVDSMSDLIHVKVPFEFIYKVFEVMYHSQHHTFQILTKRADRMQKILPDIYFHLQRNYPDKFITPLPNVWIGVSCEDQETADERIPLLLQTPAAIRFISAEPLLGAIDLTPSLNGIDWVIVGGESGPKARPMHPNWVWSLRDQCVNAGVPFFFKQWGEWCPAEGDYETCEETYLAGELQNGEETAVPLGMNNRSKKNHYWDNEVFAVNIGKKKAGRLLDGVEWNQFPAIK